MDFLTSTTGQAGLPRYFSQVFRHVLGLRNGRLDFVLPDGRRFRAEGPGPGPAAEVQVVSRDLFARLIREGELGFSEAFVDGDWQTPDLQAFLDLILMPGNLVVPDSFPGAGLIRGLERLRFWFHSNSRAQARRNIAAHYDLGNEFYRLWLDESMTYSSALFRTGRESLERAQAQKYAALLERIGAKPGEHLLEIGCGWGGFAEFAAGRGMRVTGLTISPAQHEFATERIRRAGLADRVTIRLEDYRDHHGLYDGIASIEMFEAVGEKYWPVYFRGLADRLRPGRNAVLQIITIAEDRWPRYRASVDFIQKYIFPGGMLPSPGALRDQARRAGLLVTGSAEFGQSYSQTLRRWHETFLARWQEIRALGFDDRFRRLWEFYLAACAGAFRGQNCDVTQITLTRPAN
ncbi:SAM-dependent methyltransferase [Pseudogemmobacter bohemicus]|uniref:SAM-dependent methyltransferase n=1 Tax=Pseudogemmobacter bohemicus TaxID=2250708 RepID=UPI000DD2D3E1|nr:cyclopropane-fatty-acyl-phospholipid synthase family protein [Pseudogemmobacter bohemicus]